MRSAGIAGLAALLVAAGGGMAGGGMAGAARAAERPYAARVGVDCTQGRLVLTLENRSARAASFTVTGPERGQRAAPEVAAGRAAAVRWSLPPGTPYALRVSGPGGFRAAERGRAACGLRAGTPGMNTTRLFTTRTVFRGMLADDGAERPGTAASVRIPALAATNSGTLLAAVDARVDGPSDLPADIQVGLRRSTDGGATWSPPEIVAHAESTRDGTGDSSLLVDRATGRVFLFYNYGPPGTNFFAGNTKSGRVLYRTSDDDGRTWSPPVDVTPGVKDPSWAKLFAASGHGIQTSTGRLVQPLVYRDERRATHAANLISDDHGKTWRTGAAAGTGVNESKPVQRGATGALAQNMRHNEGGARHYATSPDGARPFGPMTRSALLVDPGNNADEISHLRPGPGLPGLTRDVLFSNTASAERRHELTVRYSRDDGASWPYRAVLKPGLAGYSALAVLRDGTVGCLYEVGATGGIHFSRFRVGWLGDEAASGRTHRAAPSPR
ncbi:sialidase family protein [Streptomyces boncukensis]|uniref:exo-alpha-sialidase n=1 Tax=Streptomyces boncukensis TaxID=2711219 RepID=A0A6G4WZ37_9ACTN|nr:sialidase family protein [Streptomyces boncukensis]NGO69900.1 exo-alpha-sialidase [Streptomyces boncukensis]